MATTSTEDLTQRLPLHVLDAILLETAPPRVLAAARCVCKAWRAAVDARGLPLSVSGIVTHPTAADDTLLDFFGLPPHQSSSSTTEIPATVFDRLDDTDGADPLMVVQHCNGLLLLGDGESCWRVLNPATGQWARLPSPPPLRFLGKDDYYGYEEDPDYEDEDGFLVFDPTVSPNYQVLINSVCFWPDFYHAVKPSAQAREWPLSSYTVRVFSSETRQWEKKQFTRQGEARGTVQDMLWSPPPHYCYGAYWRGAIDVHQRDFVMRMNLSDYTYQVVKLPKCDLEECWRDWYLGKSTGGVYCALFKGPGVFGLQVWFLDETCGQMRWELKRDVDLQPLLASLPSEDHGDVPWDIQCAHQREHDMSNGTIGISEEKYVRRTLSILGFHPYKEVVFIHIPSKRVMAYQFNSNEAEDLGYLPMDQLPRHRIHSSFPYTPCRMGELSSKL